MRWDQKSPFFNPKAVEFIVMALSVNASTASFSSDFTVFYVRIFVSIADMGQMPMAVVDHQLVLDARKYLKLKATEKFLLGFFFFFLTALGVAAFGWLLRFWGPLPVELSFGFMALSLLIWGLRFEYQTKHLPNPQPIIQALDVLYNLEVHLGQDLIQFANKNKVAISKTAAARCREIATEVVQKQDDFKRDYKEFDYSDGADVSKEHRMLDERYNFFLGLELVPPGGVGQFYPPQK